MGAVKPDPKKTSAPLAGNSNKKKAAAEAKEKEKKAKEEVAKKAAKADMGDIFAGLTAPAAAASSTTAADSTGKKIAGKKRDREAGGGEKKKKQEKSDGLYKAPAAEDEFDLDDDAFFSRDGGKSVRRTPDGMRLLTEEEICRATNAGSKKAGTTIHCPFDCDCCF